MYLIVCQLHLNKAVRNLKEQKKNSQVMSNSVNIHRGSKKLYAWFGKWLRELALSSARCLKDGWRTSKKSCAKLNLKGQDAGEFMRDVFP